MIPVPSGIQGKGATFGDIVEPFGKEGFELGSNWEFNQGYFDSILERNGEETIFLRLPVDVVKGELDERDAELKFNQPFLLRHVVHLGIADDSTPLLSQMGPIEGTFNQFQTPAEKDGEIENVQQRLKKATAAIEKLMPYVH